MYFLVSFAIQVCIKQVNKTQEDRITLLQKVHEKSMLTNSLCSIRLINLPALPWRFVMHGYGMSLCVHAR